jgi:hypothetical protein
MTGAAADLARKVAATLSSRCTHEELGQLGTRIGINVPVIAGASKRDRAIAMFEGKADRDVAGIALTIGQHFREPELEEAALAILESGELSISEITRRDLARCYGEDLNGERDLLELLRQFFPIDAMPFDFPFGRSLADEISQHMIRNPGDWSVEDLFDRVGAYKCSRRRFVGVIEATLNPLARRGETQEQLVQRLDPILRRDGFCFELAGEESGYPVYRVSPVRSGVSGAPKNLIFASIGPKPEIGLGDAINNDIVILSNEASCLVYDRPLRQDGLLWSELVDWYAARNGADESEPARALGQRLRASLASDGERALFEEYFRAYRPLLGASLPALIPQVYLHYDPAIVGRLRHRRGLPRQRMDFLLLLPARSRVVLEVDGKQHFSSGDRPSLEAYSAMVSADRDLRLAGYEVYRFGANELIGESATSRIRSFFDRLLELHGIDVGS